MIKNPILEGFHPDPCLCRKGDDFYLACSTFEWMPSIPIYHSKDLKNWEHLTNVITDEKMADLKKLPSAKGIWAPCLTYCAEEDLFYVVYGVMNSMNARYFDVDNYLITAKNIEGPWSEPVYLHSAGFDASILHDDNGKKWVVSLLWETRDGYEKPGQICVAEYDPKEKKIVEMPKPVYRGSTDRGCLEAPHLYKKNGKYYLMCAEGGTGYYHCVTLARSDSPYGPYEGDPKNPIITSFAENRFERQDTDHLKPHYYAPGVELQKSGHGSLIELPDGTPYVAHLCSRPLMPEKCCVLGRETAIQKMKWTEDGWLRMASGSNIAQAETEETGLPEFNAVSEPEKDDFNSEKIGVFYMAPRIMPESFADLNAHKGYIRLRGQESLSSTNKTSLLARRLESLNTEIETKMEFTPECYRHSAGLVLYYDNMNYIYLRKTFSDNLGCPVLSLVEVDNGSKTDIPNTEVKAPDCPVYLKITVDGKKVNFSYKFEEDKDFSPIGGTYETAKFSDEYSNFGEFTGTLAGIACTDEIFRKKTADFDYLTFRRFDK